MTSLDVLNNLKIASPCPASWSGMRGDDRVRFCETCAKNVYNVSDLTSAKATALIEQAEGRLCMRLYRRADGTVLTADCPAGLRSALRRRILRLATAGVVLAAAVQSAVSFGTQNDKFCRELPPMPTGPGVRFSDWADWAAMALRLKQPPGRGAGGPFVVAGDVF